MTKLSSKSSGCVEAAIGLGPEDTTRLMELHQLYADAGMTSDAAIRKAANDLVAELDEEATDITKAVRELLDGVAQFSNRGREHEFEMSTRMPTAVKATEDPMTSLLVADFESAQSDLKWIEATAELVQSYPNYKRSRAKTSAGQLEHLVAHMVDNLLWLHDQVPAETRARSKLWYDGARAITDRWTKRYGATDAQVAGVLAVLSPQKDWFMNVDLARRILDTVTERQAFQWSPQMEATAARIFGKDAYEEDVDAIRGQTLGDLDSDYLRGMWVRVYDQAHNSAAFNIISPEGDAIAQATTKTGEQSRVAWGGVSTIAKAVSIMRLGDAQTISDALGYQHKVRNFFNNILVPGSLNGHVTIDTHAVAAALLRALSGKSREVLHNFGGGVKGEKGSKSSNTSGLRGTYALYEEAYRRAAEERGILPREMQSITWEAVRGMYLPGFKSQQKNVDAVDAVWTLYQKGKISHAEARKQVLELSGGIQPPSWSGPDAAAYDADEEADDAGDLSADGVSGSDPGETASRADRDAAGAVPSRGDGPKFSNAADRGGRDEGRELAPLEGAPAIVGATGPDPRLVSVAERYARANGISLKRQAEYVKVDPERASRIAAAYEAMPHAPQDPKVREAFDNLIRQTRAQYDALIADGYEFTFFDDSTDPYGGNPWNAIRDLRANKTMAVYGTYVGFGTEGITAGASDDNPMLADTGLRWPDQGGVMRPVAANDLFRAVHDAFGHGFEGAGFRVQGEENAWQAHVRLFTGSAVAAITTETRGQNSWLNYGPYGETNRSAGVADTVFAPQKTGLMPEWTWREGRAGDMPSFSQRPSDTAPERDADRNTFTPDGLTDLLKTGRWAVLTAEDPGAQKASAEANAAAMQRLKIDLREVGAKVMPAVGKYGDVQGSLIVTNIDEDKAIELGAKYGQESILTRRGLVYMDGRPDTVATGVQVFDTAPDDFYTEIPGTGAFFSVDLDWGDASFSNKRAPIDDIIDQVTANGITDPKQLQALLNSPGYSVRAQSAAARDVDASAAVADYLADNFPGSDWRRPTWNPGQGYVSAAGDWADKDPSGTMMAAAGAARRGAPTVIRGHVSRGVKQELMAAGFKAYQGNQERMGRPDSALITLIKPAGGVSASTPLFSNKPGRLDDIEAYHFSKAQRMSLSGGAYGTGLQGSGRDEYLKAADQRRRQRVYFYVDKGTGINPEAGVGAYAHRATLSNVYDTDSDPLGLAKGTQAATETAVLDAGFDGYLSRLGGTQSGQVIMLGPQSIKVSPLPAGERPRSGKVVPPATAKAPAAKRSGDQLVMRPAADDMMAFIKARKAVEAAAPSFRMEFGEARVKISEAAAADAAFEVAGSKFRFGAEPGPAAPAKPQAAGLLFVAADTGRVLLLKRGSGVDQAGTWSVVGGAIDAGETPEQAAKREAREEIGFTGDVSLKLWTQTKVNGITYATYAATVPSEFEPKKNWENSDHGWFEPGALPPGLHPGVVESMKAAPLPGPQFSNQADALGYNPELPRGQVLEPSAAELALEKQLSDLEGRAAAAWSESRRSAIDAIIAKLRKNPVSAEFDEDLLKSIAGSQFYSDRQAKGDAAPEFDEYREAAARVQELRVKRREMIARRVGPPEFEGVQQLADFQRPVVETAAFKKWFNGSEVVGRDGRPLIAVHGTNKDITSFQTVVERGELLSMNNWMGELGSWFAAPSQNDGYEAGSAEATADTFAELRGDEGAAVYPVFLSIKNPYDVDSYETLTDERDAAGGAKAFREKLIAKGHDGVVVLDSDTDGGQFRDDWVAFYPTQIKSALGNSGAFDPANPDIRFANAAKFGGRELPGETRTQKARRVAQDYFLRTKVVQDVIIGTGGRVGEAQDVYRAEERMYGRVQAQLEDFAKRWVTPMIERAAKAGIDMDELALYAYAKHAPERNRQIDSINPGMRGAGSGMADADAAQIVSDVQASGKARQFEDLRQDLLAIAETTRQVLLQDGLITQEEHDAWTGAYQDYVPLRGLENVDDEGRPKPGVGRGVNIRGKESTRALGRRSRAGEIVENIVRDYERAVIRGERNNVAKTFLDLVTTNPDPELWEVNAQKTSRGFSKTLGLVTMSTATETGDDTVGVKVGGQQIYIKVKDPLLVRAMRQAAKDETGEFQSMLAQSLGVYNNWLRNTLTRYNPVFGAVNAVRDLQAGAVATLDKLGARGLKLYAGHYRAALAASVRNEFDALGKQGSVFGDPVMDRWFDEYRRAGGTTAGWFLRDVEDIHTDIRQMLVAAGSAPRNTGERITGSAAWQGAKALLKYVELFGSASENAGRVAAYRAAREMGRSPAESASIAKNLTTNFNRKGEWGTALSSAYLFFNAAVQGTARVLEALKNPRVQALMAGVTGLAATLAVMGAGMGGDDDDGQAYWDKIPQSDKERNLIIMLPPGIQTDGAEKVGGMGRYIKIPMPYGFNVFATLGYTMADVGRNAVDPARGVKPAKAAINMVSAVAGSYNPMGGAFDVTDPVSVGMAVAPTIVDAGIQLGAGVNSFGTPVGPKGSPFDSRPDSERFTVTQGGGAAQRVARWVNEKTGGNRARSGAIDLMPGTLENVVNMAGGGTGRFLMDVFVNVPTKLSGTGDEQAVFRYRDLPFLRNFAGQVDENVDRGLFYERMDEVLKEARTAKNEMKLGVTVKYDPRSRAMQSLGKMSDSYSGMMTDLRKEDLLIVNDPSLTAPEKKSMRRDVEKRRNELVREFNRTWIETERDLARGSFDKE